MADEKETRDKQTDFSGEETEEEILHVRYPEKKETSESSRKDSSSEEPEIKRKGTKRRRKTKAPERIPSSSTESSPEPVKRPQLDQDEAKWSVRLTHSKAKKDYESS